MKGTELIRWALQMTDEGLQALVWDVREHAMTRPNGNHPLWTLGHLAYIEASLPSILFGEKHPLERWGPLFGPGSRPRDDAKVYPTFDEVLETYKAARQKTLALLKSIGESGLDRVPAAPPPPLADSMKTFGQTILLLCLHQMVHYGQIADTRRVAGLKPLL